METLHIYPARRIHTMETSLPQATCVGVIGERIVAVGDMADMAAWREGRKVVVDERYRDKVLLPGLIDNHVHPFLGAFLTPLELIAPEAWRRPDGSVAPAARTPEQYLARLKERLAATDPKELFISFGYQPKLHGRMFRAELDALCPDRAVILWQRSYHETYLNSRALEVLGIPQQQVDAHPQADWATGHFYETGNKLVVARLMSRFLTPQWYGRGLAMTVDLMHQGGITTAGDMLFGGNNPAYELEALDKAVVKAGKPVRVVHIPDARGYSNRAVKASFGPPDAPIDFAAGLAAIDEYRASPHDQYQGKIVPIKAVKLFADGAMFSQLMQMRPPGYTDGHHGEWLMSPERLHTGIQTFWKAGYAIHVHVNGDAGMDAVIAALEAAQRDHPRFDHRFHVHHVGISAPDQIRKLAALGAHASVNPYYIHSLADDYSLFGVGAERASQITRCGSMVRAGMRVSFHSDYMMAPTEPLLLAWCAANRLTNGGRVAAPAERLTLEQALRGVTIDAAWALGLDHEIGSIACGKKADFVVLEDDPFEIGVERLKDVRVSGTVFEGGHFPLARPTASVHAESIAPVLQAGLSETDEGVVAADATAAADAAASAGAGASALRASARRGRPRSAARYRPVKRPGQAGDACCAASGDQCEIVRLWASWMQAGFEEAARKPVAGG